MKSNENTYLSQLYSSYLFELPNLFDLCVLFEENESISKLISNVIRKNANDYKTQFKKLITNMMKVNEFNLNKNSFYWLFSRFLNQMKLNYKIFLS
jgi:iron-sulfur cluster repair protein YtfE (RIC family)